MVWEWVMKKNRGRIRGRCIVGYIPNRKWHMLLREFLFNPFELIDMWTKMSVIAIHTTHGTWLIGSNYISMS